MNIIILDQVNYRQRDEKFLKVLNEIRCGQVSADTHGILREKVRDSVWNRLAKFADDTTPSRMPIKLFSRNKDVNEYNNEQLQALMEHNEKCLLKEHEEMMQYKAEDDGIDMYRRQLDKGLKAPGLLQLCKGSQVMLVKNLDTSQGLVNGAIGTVMGFASKHSLDMSSTGAPHGMFQWYPIVEFVNNVTKEKISYSICEETWEISAGDRVVAWRTQLPLVLAWGISIHKSQGLQFTDLHISLKGIFDYGQCYVALSRCESLDGLSLDCFSPSAVRVNDRVVKFYDRIYHAIRETTTTTSKTTMEVDDSNINNAVLLSDLVTLFKTGKVGMKIATADGEKEDIDWYVSNVKKRDEYHDDFREDEYDEWLEYTSSTVRRHNHDAPEKKRKIEDGMIKEVNPLVDGKVIQVIEGTVDERNVYRDDAGIGGTNNESKKMLMVHNILDDSSTYIRGSNVGKKFESKQRGNAGDVDILLDANNVITRVHAGSEFIDYKLFLGRRKDVENKKRRAQGQLLRF